MFFYLPYILGGDSVGFLTIRERDNINTTRCNSTFETALTWTCDSTKVWDSTSQNVTRFMQTATKGLDNCFVSVYKLLLVTVFCVYRMIKEDHFAQNTNYL